MRTQLHAHLEAILMVVTDPVPAAELAEALDLPAAEVTAALRELAAEYDSWGEAGIPRGFELRETAAGFRFYSRAAHFESVKMFLTRGQSAKLSQAALETLAVVAYAQPVSRGRIAAIRGVNVDGVVRTLLMRGLIVEAPQTEDGGPTQFITSQVFLEAMGLNSLAELPEIAPFLPAGDELPESD